MTAKKISKTRTIRVGFFTSDHDRGNGIPSANLAFDQIYNDTNETLPKAYYSTKISNNLKIVLLEKDEKVNFYFGYISHSRDTLLPFIEDSETRSERSIPLGEKDWITERTYFLYYYQNDILVLSLNHLGPKANDLASLLREKIESQIYFEAIWKEDSMKELLENNSILRSCDLTIAAPRNFNAANYNLENNLSKQIISMVSGLGGSHLKLYLRGRARPKNKGFSYLSQDIKSSIRELLELFSIGSGGLKIKKAEITEPSDPKPKSLLEQVLVAKKRINVIGAYLSDSDIRTAMISAKIEYKNYISQYES
ncbi:hypothetical protein Xsto_03911 [Xenorhabdus stockiae]|uniref:Uncharacterized protein n=1 Tax=Xenorhabdus stockiae TaxID=351614 RepID=A0A2D0KAQ0_9GAMM|nr:DUF6731 family protein [Xenorhabdus stockiae]PHM60544.1 hypothetical protein Xsto_03911 [Xenorhabdus stockiae]